jgi:ribosomal protein S13
MYIGSWKIGDAVTFYANTHTTAGVATDADSLPTYRVYEDESGTPLLTGSMALLDSANTNGNYSEQITLASGSGFEKGKSYTIRIEATVGGIGPGVVYRYFQVEAEVDSNTVSPNVTVGGYAAGQDPATLIDSGSTKLTTVVNQTDTLESSVASIASALLGLQSDVDAIEAVLAAIKGAGWTDQTLVALKTAIDLKLNASDYVAPNNAGITTIINATDTLESGVAAIASALLDMQADVDAVIAAIDAIKGAGWTNQTLVALKAALDLKLNASDYVEPDNDGIADAVAQTDTVESVLTTLAAAVNSVQSDTDAIQVVLAAIMGGGWSNQTLVAVYALLQTVASQTDTLEAGLASVQEDVALILDTLATIQGVGWSGQTLVAIQAALALKLNTSAYVAPDNAGIATIESAVAAIASSLLDVQETGEATEAAVAAVSAVLEAIKGPGWSTQTLVALKAAVDLKLNTEDYTEAPTVDQIMDAIAARFGEGSYVFEPLGDNAVTIRVRDDLTNPVFGVKVTLRAGGSIKGQKITGVDGTVVFNLSAGDFTVDASVVGYNGVVGQEFTVSGDQTEDVTLTTLTISEPVMPGACVVYGYVFDGAGNPIEDAEVRVKLIDQPDVNDEVLLSLKEQTVTTNSDGLFEVNVIRKDQFRKGFGRYEYNIPAIPIVKRASTPNADSYLFNNLV